MIPEGWEVYNGPDGRLLYVNSRTNETSRTMPGPSSSGNLQNWNPTDPQPNYRGGFTQHNPPPPATNNREDRYNPYTPQPPPSAPAFDEPIRPSSPHHPNEHHMHHRPHYAADQNYPHPTGGQPQHAHMIPEGWGVFTGPTGKLYRNRRTGRTQETMPEPDFGEHLGNRNGHGNYKAQQHIPPEHGHHEQHGPHLGNQNHHGRGHGQPYDDHLHSRLPSPGPSQTYNAGPSRQPASDASF